MKPAAVPLVLICLALAAGAVAATPPPASKASAKAAKAKPRKPAAARLPEATDEQREAATRVLLGHFDCELRQAIEIEPNAAAAGYFDVRHGKTVYVMKPVLSSTGAVRLEDVKARTLLVQIATKSMLLDVKAGRRLVDDCVNPNQREAAVALQAQAAQAAASAASAAQAAASAAASAASAAAVAADAASGAAQAAGMPASAGGGAAAQRAQGAGASAATP